MNFVVERFEEALCVLAAGVAGEVLRMDSTSGEKCTFSAGMALVDGWGRFSWAVDLLSVGVLALLVGVQCVRVCRYAIRYTLTDVATGFKTGGEGVLSGLAVCAYDPFGRGKFIRIASTDRGVALLPRVQTLDLNSFQSVRPKKQKKEGRGRA